MKIISPMLAGTGRLRDLVNDNFIYEPKMDGVRIICSKENGRLSFFNRKGREVGANYPELNRPGQIKAESCLLDGELVVYNEKGNPDFDMLMKRDQLGNLQSIRKLSNEIPATFVVFDLLMKDGRDLSGLPLAERKKLLQEIIKDSPRIQKIHYTENGLGLWDFILSRQLEGVVAKKSDSAYAAGKRSMDWLRIKNFRTEDFLIAGYTQEQREISSLVLCSYENGHLQLAGKVGTGFSALLIEQLYPQLREARIDEPPLELTSAAAGSNIQWVRPKLVCEVQYVDVNHDGTLDSPIFLRMRPDKPGRQCIRQDQPGRKELKKQVQPLAQWDRRA
jgi:DNA ligase D-like protein (predicted ligase)